MGMDWHSSGITTSVIGALKRGLAPLAGELGIHVCGGRGRHSRATPGELVAIGDRVGFDGAALAQASRLVAKVDSAAVQDGFDLYLHGFIVTDDGHWVVVQQGMNGDRRQARRYHWLSEGLTSFVDAPHAAIEGPGQGEIVNLADRRARSVAARAGGAARRCSGRIGIVAASWRRSERAPRASRRRRSQQPQLGCCRTWSCPPTTTCAPSDVVTAAPARQLWPRRPNAVRRISPNCCWCRASAHGRCAHWRWWPRWCTARRAASPIRRASRSRMAARTGIRSRCRPRSMTSTIGVLKSAVRKAKLGREEELEAIRRLDAQARRLKRMRPGRRSTALIAEERAPVA